MVSTRVAFAACLGVVAVAASACSSDASGEATPEPTSSVSSSAAAPSSESSTVSLADVDPCSLITRDELGKYGGQQLKGPMRKNIGSSVGCGFEKPLKVDPVGTLIVTAGIRAEQGIKDANDNGYGIQKTEADGRQFARIPGPGNCTVAIEVAQSSRVDVYVGTSRPTETACQIASEVADVVAPKLPKG